MTKEVGQGDTQQGREMAKYKERIAKLLQQDKWFEACDVAEDAFAESMDYLGKSPDEMAETLRSEKIRGSKNDDERNPISVFLTVSLFFHTEISASKPYARLLMTHGRKFIYVAPTMPRAANDFLTRFNNGEYPDLVVMPEGKDASVDADYLRKTQEEMPKKNDADFLKRIDGGELPSLLLDLKKALSDAEKILNNARKALSDAEKILTNARIAKLCKRKKWEKAFTVAVDHLGKSSEEIAEKLRSENIRGIKNDGFLNPLSKFLSVALDLNVEIYAANEYASFVNPGRKYPWLAVNLPQSARDFLIRFNNGEFPDLEEKETSCDDSLPN